MGFRANIAKSVFFIFSGVVLFAFTSCTTAKKEVPDFDKSFMEQRIALLESRVALLEAKPQIFVSPTPSTVSSVKTAEQIAEQNINKRVMQKKARIRMNADSKVYSEKELKALELYYQAAAKETDGVKKKIALLDLVEKYPKANRAGCCLLYAAQMSTGEEQTVLFRRAIEQFDDCYYGNGVQVGPMARYFLIEILLAEGKKQEAVELVEELKKSYPDAIGHDGVKIVTTLHYMNL